MEWWKVYLSEMSKWDYCPWWRLTELEDVQRGWWRAHPLTGKNKTSLQYLLRCITWRQTHTLNPEMVKWSESVRRVGVSGAIQQSNKHNLFIHILNSHTWRCVDEKAAVRTSCSQLQTGRYSILGKWSQTFGHCAQSGWPGEQPIGIAVL